MSICETVASILSCIFNANCISDLEHVQVCAKVIFSSVQVSFFLVFSSSISADCAGLIKLIFRENSDLAKVDRVKTFACDAKSAVQPCSDD